jgi:nucleoredoxin
MTSRCGPCKQFTPKLAQFYTDMKKKGKKLEVVWVSRDQTEQDFVKYYEEMPWLAVTIENIPKCLKATSDRFQVRGIPHLVILDGYDATTISLDGRTKVLQDPYGLEFPWRPRTPGALLKRFVPQSVRSLVGAQVRNFRLTVRNLLRRVLSSVLPARLVNMIVGVM